MAKHIVKCQKCGKQFDTNEEQAVKLNSRRYGHAACYPDIKDLVPMIVKVDKDPDMTALKDYISNLYGNKARWPLIMKQIKTFHEKGFTTSGILGTLVYFYEVQKGSVAGTNGGIGIVEYTYEDAKNYYNNIQKAQEANANKTLLTQIKEIIIKPPKAKGTKRKFFNIEELEDEE